MQTIRERVLEEIVDGLEELEIMVGGRGKVNG